MKSKIDRYNREIAGTSIDTLPPSGWEFEDYNSDIEIEDGIELHFCISHKTAQYTFALDNYFSVYLLDEKWIKIYESVFNLVYLEKAFNEKLSKIEYVNVVITPIGHFESIQHFESLNKTMLNDYDPIKCNDEPNSAVYFKQGEVIKIGRFYDSDNFSLYAIRYSNA